MLVKMEEVSLWWRKVVSRSYLLLEGEEERRSDALC